MTTRDTRTMMTMKTAAMAKTTQTTQTARAAQSAQSAQATKCMRSTRIMKKTACAALAVVLMVGAAFGLAGCSEKSGSSSAGDGITMLVSMGNGQTYYEGLAQSIKEDLGIDVTFVYGKSSDTTNQLRLCFKNNDLPADIVFTSSKTDDEWLKDSCVDLMGCTNVASLLTPTTANNCTTEDGAMYQIPISSKMIGITYNETLMNEMGWSVPETYEDMLDLKEKCEQEGVQFAVSDGSLTGHGFNWMFHLMGSQWLSTLEGTNWLENYQAGNATIDEFKEQCAYFEQWTEDGLWGEWRSKEADGSTVFSTQRVLFWFGIVNTLDSYQGPELDENGKETGKTLNDTYKTMPWISEDGSNNCFTLYDNAWMYINKDLEQDQAKLDKAVKIVEYMATQNAIDLAVATAKDAYVAVNDFEITDDRLYSEYKQQIAEGYVQPWFYNEFDSDSIVLTGEKINAFIAGEGTFDEIFETLDQCNTNALNSEIEVLGTATQKLGCDKVAEIVAASGAMALDESLADAGQSVSTQVSLVPYTANFGDMQPWIEASVVSAGMQAGDLDYACYNSLIPPNTTSVSGVYMTGKEIKALVNAGFDPSDRFIDEATGQSKFDSTNYGPYPYACLVKEGTVDSLADDEEYLVCLYEGFITKAAYSEYAAAGKVIELTSPRTYADGLKLFFAQNPTVGSGDVSW